MKAVQFLISLGVGIALGTAVTLADEAAKPVNTTCPISGEPVDADVTSSYTKVVGFCCDKCLTKHNKNPAANVAKIAAMPAGKIVNSKCPVSGKAIDAEQTVVFHGAKVGLCCEKCVTKFTSDPEAVAAKVVYDTAANETCPVSKKAVDAEKVATFTMNVGFCCKKCKAKFDKDPDKHIAKVETDSAEKK